MPLTSSGKVNRKALPDIDLNDIASAVEYVSPVGEIEKRLAALMEETLDYSPIGRNDDFFNLGGDSLRAIEFVTKAHGAGIYFALQNVFNYPTVESLCNWVTVQKVYVFNGFGVVPYECVDHAILLKRLYHMGVKDRRVLQIIKAMLKAGVMDACKDNEEGTPQGGLISPLLANVYLDMMDEWITK